MASLFERVLITGCGGMLGNAVYPHFRANYANVLATDIHQYNRRTRAPWQKELDVTQRDQVRAAMADYKPDLVLHLAALVDMEICEDDPELSELLNVTATQIVAEEAERVGATVVYISTGGVFDGGKPNPPDNYYTEEDPVDSICVYGKTKHGGELHVRNICSKYYIVRPGWMTGGGYALDRKFVGMILDQIERGEKTIYGVDDKWGTPTYTYAFAKNLDVLLGTEQHGTYHMVCKEPGTRYDIAAGIVEIVGRKDIEMQRVKSDFFSQRFHAPRPPNEILVNKALEDLGINLMPTWREAFEEYIPRHFPHLMSR
jgi:dTDP-4-dehydrorhamnose reductase